jgi:transcriptional regulator with XRE-family HTH domain
VLSKLRVLRAERRLSQAELARRSGFPQQYLSQLENGLTPRRLADVDALARALGVPAAGLLDLPSAVSAVDEERRG